MNRQFRHILLGVIMVALGLCGQGCCSLSDNQEAIKAEDEIMESILQAKNSAPVAFYEDKTPLDYFRPVCDEEGVLQYKVKKVDAKTIQINNNVGKMRVLVIFESCLPLDQGETDVFNVDLKIEKNEDGWYIASVNPEQ